MNSPFLAIGLAAAVFGLAQVAHADEAVAPAPAAPVPQAVEPSAPPPSDGALRPLAAPNTAPSKIELGEPETRMHSVGMMSAGIALVVGGVIEAVIGGGIVASEQAQSGSDLAGILTAILGVPLLVDGGIQLAVGIPLIVVGTSRDDVTREAALAPGVPSRQGMKLNVSF